VQFYVELDLIITMVTNLLLVFMIYNDKKSADQIDIYVKEFL